MKALLVEDSPGMRKIISIMLKSMGYNQIIEARHGGEALDYLRSAEMGNSTSAITKHLKFSGKCASHSSVGCAPLLACDQAHKR